MWRTSILAMSSASGTGWRFDLWLNIPVGRVAIKKGGLTSSTEFAASVSSTKGRPPSGSSGAVERLRVAADPLPPEIAAGRRLFFTELESVYEEKNLSLDSTDGRGSEAMMKQLFPTHPYGTQTTIGSIEHLKSPAYQDMIDYFHRWYAPNNMAVLLAGDIDAATALPVLEKTLGTWEPRALEKPTPATPTKITTRVASEVIGEGEQAVSLGWSTVPYTHPDEPVLTVMHWLLDNGTSGLFNAELELTQKVPDASAYGYSILESGVFMARATAREALAAAIATVFGDRAIVQRCQVHKARNVRDHLPQERRAYVRKQMRDAYKSKSAKTAKMMLGQLASWLEANGEDGAAASLRGDPASFSRTSHCRS